MKIRDMDDRHLLNTIRMLERNAEQMRQNDIAAGWICLGGFQGEMASYYAEQDLMRLEESSAEELLEDLPEYQALIQEADRRKLSLVAE